MAQWLKRARLLNDLTGVRVGNYSRDFTCTVFLKITDQQLTVLFNFLKEALDQGTDQGN